METPDFSDIDMYDFPRSLVHFRILKNTPRKHPEHFEAESIIQRVVYASVKQNKIKLMLSPRIDSEDFLTNLRLS